MSTDNSLEVGAASCPVCAATNILLDGNVSFALSATYHTLYATLKCWSCHAVWDNVYTFNRYVNLDPSEKHAEGN